MRLDPEVTGPTILGVTVSQVQTYVDHRRVLVVSYNSQEPPGTLGYAVVVRPGYAVGDHFHHRREERIILLHGRAEFRLLDQRPDSETRGTLNLFYNRLPGHLRAGADRRGAYHPGGGRPRRPAGSSPTAELRPGGRCAPGALAPPKAVEE